MLNPIRLLRRLGWLAATPRMDRELDEELRFHLDMETARLVAQGIPEGEARARARRTFGDWHHRDAARDARGVRPLSDFLQDLRVAGRSLFKQRGFSVVAVLTLAIGIGATTALGSAVYRVLLEPYPFAEAHRIVAVQQFDQRTGAYGLVAPANYLDLKQRTRSFELLAAAEPWSVDWMGPDGPEVFEAALVTQDAFPIQGLTPLRGRAFLPGEFAEGEDRVVLLSEALWRTRFGASESLVGSTLVLDSIPRMVIGVMSEDALQPYGARVWLPKTPRPADLRRRTGGYWNVLARLGSGVTIEKAGAELTAIGSQLAAEYPGPNATTSFKARSLREAIAGQSKGTLLILLGAVSFVLFIACVNVTALQLAESVRRRREFAVRAAIGAGKGRLIRQLLTENLLIAVTGGLAGLLLAAWGIATIRGVAPDSLWQLRTLRFGLTPIMIALGLAALAAFATALIPVMALGRLRLSGPLASGSPRTGGSRDRSRANGALVIAEVSLALVLLVGAGLLFRSLATLLQVDRGFRPDHVLVATVQAWAYYSTPPARTEFVRSARERLGALPGVTRAGMTSSLPLSYPIGFQRTPIALEGQAIATDQLPVVHTAAISPGYLEALEIPVLEGRPLTDHDLSGGPPVALVNRAFVGRFLGEGSPIGKRITFGWTGDPLTREIVGVIGDVRQDGLDQAPEPSVLIPQAQVGTGAIHLVLRTSGDPVGMERAVRAELAGMSPSMPVTVTTMDAQLTQSLRQRRFQLGLLTAFAATALLLAAIGIYGVMSRATSERTQEIGLRMAVGAGANQVRWMVLRGGGRLAGLGVLLGVAAAFALTRYLSGMLFGVSALDPLTFIGAALLLFGVALLASWVPARRASKVDPVIALRAD